MLFNAPADFGEDRAGDVMALGHALKGLRILVVEDEAMVAMMVEDMLIDLGCVVVGIAGSVEKAVSMVGCGDLALDGAVLDINLGGETVFPVADALTERHVPFIFATGYGTDGLERRYADRPTLTKPFHFRTLEQALMEGLCGVSRRVDATPVRPG